MVARGLRRATERAVYRWIAVYAILFGVHCQPFWEQSCWRVTPNVFKYAMYATKKNCLKFLIKKKKNNSPTLANCHLCYIKKTYLIVIITHTRLL